MQVILLEKVSNLGNLGEEISVKSGYGRNFLIPQGKAVLATKTNREAFETRRVELEKKAADELAGAEARKAAMDGKTFTIACRAGDEGKLFGSVGTADIAEAVTAAGQALNKHEVRLPAGALRLVGEHEVIFHLHPDVDASVTIDIIPE